jgi:hypothetical protein
MSRTRDLSKFISTPPDIYSTDAEVAATYLTQASASTIYKGSNFRNLIINGDMQVAQRSSSVASLTAGGYNTADRWHCEINTIGTWTQSVENDAPTGSGFRKSLKMLCTTADASLAAGDFLFLNQRLEGQNLQQVKKGTAAAEQLTLSFWVKSNVTGTYVVEFFDIDNSRSISQSYTVNASATWEKKTITISADTTGAFDNDNSNSFQLNWWLGAGSTYNSGTLQTIWGSRTTANIATGVTNLASAINNYWQVTGVQLEVGSTATEFEFLPAQVELAQCQRYFVSLGGNKSAEQFGQGTTTGTTLGYIQVQLPISMRSTPTSVGYSSLSHLRLHIPGVTGDALTSITLEQDNSGPLIVLFTTIIASSGNYGGTKAIQFTANNTTSARLTLSAEL